MRRRRRHGTSTETALANFALTFAKALLVFCVILFLLITNKQSSDGVKPKAEYLITADWQAHGIYDVDLWTKLPDGTRVSYGNKQSGVVFLDRDDLGDQCARSVEKTCEEITVFRGIVPGTYRVALHLYAVNHDVDAGVAAQPVVVHVRLDRLNPTTRLVWQGAITLTHVREEKQVIAFTVHPDGRISDVTSDPGGPSIVYERGGSQ